MSEDNEFNALHENDEHESVAPGDGRQYAEIFWDTAVTTTIHQTHPRVPQLKTELVCQYKFASGRLYVRTLRYKMTTRHGNWNRANIDLYVFARTDEWKPSPDSLKQDANWHDYIVQADVLLSGDEPASLMIRVDYDGTNNDVEPDEGWGRAVYPAMPPLIQSPTNGAVTGRRFRVSGVNGLTGGTIQVIGLRNSVTVPLGSVSSAGRWEITITMPEGYSALYAQQILNDEVSERSNLVNVAITFAQIDEPADKAVITQSKVRLKGRGIPGETVRILTPDKKFVHGVATVGSNGVWETELNSSNYPETGSEVQMVAHHQDRDDWSAIRSFVLLGLPKITAPQNGAVFDGLSISGLGMPGAVIEIFRDLDPSFKVGQALVQINGQWHVPTLARPLPPGPFSLVTRQTISGVSTPIGRPHTIKVRPPALTRIAVTPSGKQLTFTGTGHYDAKLATRINFTVTNGSVMPPPVAIVTIGGGWETQATDWPFGAYDLTAIQQISDNANGWIDSTVYRFTVNHVLPSPTHITYTKAYTPVFSGKGLTDATVRLFKPDGQTKVAPDAPVSGERWSTSASEVWGPTSNRAVHIRQYLGDHHSPDWEVLKVDIPPLAPDSVQVIENGLSPQISGTCWPGAVVTLEYNSDGVKHKPTVINGTWTYRRDEPFEPGVTHTFSVIQTAASQNSPAATGSFTVRKIMLKPEITAPLEGAEVGRNLTVRGENGMSGATMKVCDAQMGGDLNSKLLASDGEWSIELNGLEYRTYFLEALQTLDGIDSPASDLRECQVVLEPPMIGVPAEGDDLPRRSIVSGTGWPGAQVTVWLEGRDEPLLRNLSVGAAGEWSGSVVLDQAGHHRLCARQTFLDQVSRFLQRDCRVVPSVPMIESPGKDAAVGSSVVVSGFGYPGDTVTVKLADGPALGSTVVLEDRTWSLSANIDHPGGAGGLTVEAACGEFVSSTSDAHPVRINTWLPCIEKPPAGLWVCGAVSFAGRGKAGVGQLVSWFNPEVVWAADLLVSDGQWQGETLQELPPGGHWCRFRQRFEAGSDPAQSSDWAESQRFEVLPPPRSS